MPEIREEDIKSEEYQKDYSEVEFWEKVGKFAKKAGISVIYAGVLLYEVLNNGKVPVKEKAIIIGALGYFISPIDFIPDMIPVLGFTDDLTALGMALFKVKMYVTEDDRIKARAKLTTWFKSVNDEDLAKVEEYL